MKSGFVSIIGRPNVGKSTLVNTIVNEKVAITSDKSGTTRNIIQGIYNDSDCQIVFVDTPGIGKPQNRLGKVLNKEALSLTKDVDLILFVVDAYSGIGKGDKYILDILRDENVPVILILNKIDQISEEILLLTIEDIKDLFPFKEIIPVSALKNINVDHLLKIIKSYLKEGPKYFKDEEYTSSPMTFMASEIVREKILNETNDEIPHSVTCKCVKYEEGKNIDKIYIDIIVERDSLKKIIIGKSGLKLKKIGTEAREELEKIVDKKVYLELYVKTIPNWRDKEKYLSELGFKDFE